MISDEVFNCCSTQCNHVSHRLANTSNTGCTESLPTISHGCSPVLQRPLWIKLQATEHYTNRSSYLFCGKNGEATWIFPEFVKQHLTFFRY